ncbi:MAG TPA: phage tail tip lysozyme [Polyangiaceae bacterium]
MSQRALRSLVLAPCLLASMAVATAGCSAASGSGEDVGSTSADVSSSEHTAYSFFVGKGLKGFQAAGIVGNLQQESDVDPTAIEYGGGQGRGIAQWSTGGRWNADHDDNMVWYASVHGLNEWSLTPQLEFIWYELEHDASYGLAELRASGNVTDATLVFQDRFEGCGTCDQSNRIAYAKAVLSAYGGSGGGSGGGGGGGKGCYSDTLAREMPDNACVQSKYDSAWYQCDNGSWADRWTDPAACDGVYPL